MNNNMQHDFNFDFLQSDTQHAKIAKDALYSMNQILDKLEQEYNNITFENLEEQTNLFLAKCNEFCMYVPIPKSQLHNFLDEIAFKLKNISILLKKNNKIQESNFLLNFAYKFVRSNEKKKDFLQTENDQKISVYIKIILILICIALSYVGYISNNSQLLGIGMVSAIIVFAFCYSNL